MFVQHQEAQRCEPQTNIWKMFQDPWHSAQIGEPYFTLGDIVIRGFHSARLMAKGCVTSSKEFTLPGSVSWGPLA